jgi:hypothetical protein
MSSISSADDDVESVEEGDGYYKSSLAAHQWASEHVDHSEWENKVHVLK